MTCLELGGACEVAFSADTFEQISKLSQDHGRQMAAQSEPGHLNAMEEMMAIMSSGGFESWYAQKEALFNSR